MKSVMTVLALLMSSAWAATVDCSTIQLYNTLGLSYSTTANFPNTPQEKLVWLPDLTAPVTLCGVTFSFDRATQVATIASKSFKSLAIIGSEMRATTTMDFPLYEDQTVGRQKQALSVSIGLYTTYPKYSVQAIINPVAFNDTVLGVRFDGGQLQPLFYNNQAPSIDFPKSVKTIDLYARSKFNPSWQRVTLNFKTPKITVYLKSAFPSK